MATTSTTIGRTDFGTVKRAIHRKLIQKLNLDRITESNREEVRRQVSSILEALVVGESTPMNLQERERLVQEVLNEVFGLGRSNHCSRTKQWPIFWSIRTRTYTSSGGVC